MIHQISLRRLAYLIRIANRVAESIGCRLEGVVIGTNEILMTTSRWTPLGSMERRIPLFPQKIEGRPR